MEQFAPVVIGYGLLFIILLAAALFPRTWWAKELLRRFGVTPSGPFGYYSRRDHFMRARLSLLACLGCFAATVVAGFVMSRIPEYRPGNRVASVYLFAFFILSAMGFASMLIALWQAIFFKPRRPPIPPGLLECISLADFLERLTVEPVPDLVWARFVSSPKAHAVLEQVRLRCISLCGGKPARFQGALKGMACAWAADLRAAAK